MKRRILHQILVNCTLCLVCGCSGSGGDVKLAAADGTVTYKGSPLAGADVTFVPEKGPLAQGRTDLNGKFTLSSGALRGAAVGPAKVSVSAFPPSSTESPKKMDMSTPKTPEEAQAFFNKAGEMQIAMGQSSDAAEPPKSLVPERYLRADTSGLSFTVNANGDNHFKIELQD